MVSASENIKFCDFHKYCKLCKHYKKKETEEPCFSCMEEPINEGTAKPVNWEGRSEKKSKR